MERIQGLKYPFSPIKFYSEIGMKRSFVDIHIRSLVIVRYRRHGYDHSFILSRVCGTFPTRLDQPILTLTLI